MVDGREGREVENGILDLNFSVEIFADNGELTFTERIYWQDDVMCRLLVSAANQVRAWRLESESNLY